MCIQDSNLEYGQPSLYALSLSAFSHIHGLNQHHEELKYTMRREIQGLLPVLNLLHECVADVKLSNNEFWY
jgi:hypothetical protein